MLGNLESDMAEGNIKWVHYDRVLNCQLPAVDPCQQWPSEPRSTARTLFWRHPCTTRQEPIASPCQATTSVENRTSRLAESLRFFFSPQRYERPSLRRTYIKSVARVLSLLPLLRS